MTSSRHIMRSPDDMGPFLYHLQNVKYPYEVVIKLGLNRSLDQNALAWKWAGEIAAQRGDQTANEIHAYNKLHIAVPILRETDDEFREVYDQKIKPLPYEHKLALMAPPIDLPVTRRMKTPAMTRFLDAVRLHWSQQGVALTIPEDHR